VRCLRQTRATRRQAAKHRLGRASRHAVNAPGDVEWVGLLNRIFAEARNSAIPVSNDDQLYLCEHLVSIKSYDPLSAQAYHFLMATEPALVNPEYAWLYCRADQEHDVDGPQVLALYALTFTHKEAAHAYYTEHNWNLDDVELMFLRRAAEKAPGRYPAVLGPTMRRAASSCF